MIQFDVISAALTELLSLSGSHGACAHAVTLAVGRPYPTVGRDVIVRRQVAADNSDRQDTLTTSSDTATFVPEGRAAFRRHLTA